VQNASKLELVPKKFIKPFFQALHLLTLAKISLRNNLPFYAFIEQVELFLIRFSFVFSKKNSAPLTAIGVNSVLYPEKSIGGHFVNSVYLHEFCTRLRILLTSEFLR
jgi:hypothetical protein